MNSTAYSVRQRPDTLAYLECARCAVRTHVSGEYMDALGLLQVTPGFVPVLFCIRCNERASMQVIKSEEKR